MPRAAVCHRHESRFRCPMPITTANSYRFVVNNQLQLAPFPLNKRRLLRIALFWWTIRCLFALAKSNCNHRTDRMWKGTESGIRGGGRCSTESSEERRTWQRPRLPLRNKQQQNKSRIRVDFDARPPNECALRLLCDTDCFVSETRDKQQLKEAL